MSTMVGDMINSQIYFFVRHLRPKALHIDKMMFINTVNVVHFLQLFYVSGIYKLEVQWTTQIELISAFVT